VRFEWDLSKAEKNEKKHGVSFSEAATVFGLPSLILTTQRASTVFLVLANRRWAVFSLFPILKGKRIVSESLAQDVLRSQSRSNMSHNTESDDMRPEYDFSDGVRGKHYKAYRKGTNVVLLDPDVAEVFKNSESVNRALRLLMDLAGKEIQRNLTKGSSGCS
jgi:uncharacterized DUF497 family protein